MRLQTEGFNKSPPKHEYPGFAPEHSGLQPTNVKSSHVSGACTNPSPQKVGGPVVTVSLF
jgi:hypothetical protein